MRRSRIQSGVLALYKAFMKEGKGIPGLQDRVRHEFKKNASIPKTEVMRIEYLVRRGWNQLTTIQSSQVSGVGSFVDEKKNDRK